MVDAEELTTVATGKETNVNSLSPVIETPRQPEEINIYNLAKTFTDHRGSDIIEFNKALISSKGKIFPADQLVDFVLERGDYHYASVNDLKRGGIDNLSTPLFLSDTDDIVDGVTIVLRNEFTEGIAATDNIYKKKIALGLLVDRNGLVETLNDLKKRVDSETDETKKKQLSLLGSMLLGYDPDIPNTTPIPFHTSLLSFYAAFDLRKYNVNLANKEQEMKEIEDFIEDVDPEDTIVEIGCGTGRFTNALAQKGKKVIGIDVNPQLLDQARLGDTTKTVRYQEGTLSHTGLPDNSVRKLIVPGRTVTHVEETEGQALDDGFEGFIREMSRVLADNGEALFDMPNPKKGRYFENKRNMILFQKKFGLFPEVKSEEDVRKVAENIEYIIDTPDGVNFCQRYAPTIEGLLIILRNHPTRWDLEAEVISTTPIYNDTDDENVWIRLRKLPSKQVQTQSAALPQSVDGE